MSSVVWKVLTFVLLTIVILETSYMAYSIYVYKEELRNTNECYYNVCLENPQADYYDGVCTCYDLDMLGENYVAVKTKLMN